MSESDDAQIIWYKPGDKLLMSSVKKKHSLLNVPVTVISFEDVSEGYQRTDIRMLIDWDGQKGSLVMDGMNTYDWRNPKTQQKHHSVKFEKEQNG